MIKQVLKIMYPITFGFPRPAYQLAEVKEIMNIIKSNKIKEKNNNEDMLLITVHKKTTLVESDGGFKKIVKTHI